MENINDIFRSFQNIKNQIKNIGPGMATHNDKLNALYTRIDIFNRAYNDGINDQLHIVYNTFGRLLSKMKNRLNMARSGYENVIKGMPFAQKIADKITDNSTGLAFNIAPVVAMTAASGAVLGTVYGLTELLDPVEENIEIQSNLLDNVLAGTISQSEYVKASNDSLNDLENQDYGIQKATGMNIAVVAVGAGVIYAGYKILKHTGMLKELKDTWVAINGRT